VVLMIRCLCGLCLHSDKRARETPLHCLPFIRQRYSYSLPHLALCALPASTQNAVHKLDSELRNVQMNERAAGLHLSSSEEEDDEEAAVTSARRRQKQKQKKSTRRQGRADGTAATLYQMSNPLSRCLAVYVCGCAGERTCVCVR
jgi:hypothetical protein